MIKECKWCGKKFESKRGGKKYCSDSCRSKHNRNTVEHRTCCICGKDFVVNWKNSPTETCSRGCAKKLAARNQKITMQDTGFRRAELRTDKASKYHSENLDRKVKQYGYRYGQVQAQETLDMVGRVDVDAILAELNVPKERIPKPEPPVRHEYKAEPDAPERKKRVVPGAKCITCGGPIYDVDKRRGRYRKYCSERCKHKAYMIRNGMKKCEWCGKLFAGYSPYQRTCSRACGQKIRKERKRETERCTG